LPDALVQVAHGCCPVKLHPALPSSLPEAGGRAETRPARAPLPRHRPAGGGTAGGALATAHAFS